MKIRCPTCDFDLAGLPAAQGSGRCPECGTMATLEALRRTNCGPFAPALAVMSAPVVSAWGAWLMLRSSMGGFGIALAAGIGVCGIAAPIIVTTVRARRWNVKPRFHMDELLTGSAINALAALLAIVAAGLI